MTAATLLDRLEGVRESGPGRWLARCPSHPDKSPSLSIREADDRTLVHCFGGCEVTAVLNTVGLSLSDLFERPLEDHRAPLRDYRHTHAAIQALRVISREALIAAVAADNLAQGIALGDADRARLALAAGRIRAARAVAA